MNWTRAVHHVESAAEQCTRMTELPASMVSLRVTELWAFGDVLGPPHELERVSVALSVDLLETEVPWLSQPHASEHWLNMTRLSKQPVQVCWRSSHAPVWNHRIVRPLLVWDEAAGLHADALVALRAGTGEASGLPEPTAPELASRVSEELAVSLASVRACTQEYEDRLWGPAKMGPVADALWRASAGYLDLLDAKSVQ